MGASKDISIFANMLLKEEFDIVALQEIKGTLALNRILSALPSYWKGVADDSPYVNDYAFIWNTECFMLANSEETGTLRTYTPRIYKQYKVDRKSSQKDLIREPFYARFFPVGGAAPYIEIRLINAHIRFSKGSQETDSSEQSIGAVMMRKNEYDVLTKAIYAKEADKRYGNNRPAYTILLGDYNLNLKESGAGSPYLVESFEIVDGRDKKRIKTIQSELSTLKKPDEKADEHFANNYDHFSYDECRYSGLEIKSYRIDTVQKYCDGDYEKHLKSVSDHVPVAMEVELR